MTATQTPLQAAEQTAQQVARTLDALRRLRRLSDRELAERATMSRPQVEARRRGATPCSTGDLGKLAVALNVEPETFFLSEDAAIRWVLDNRPSFMAGGGKDAPGGDKDSGTPQKSRKPESRTLSNRTGSGRNRGGGRAPAQPDFPPHNPEHPGYPIAN